MYVIRPVALLGLPTSKTGRNETQWMAYRGVICYPKTQKYDISTIVLRGGGYSRTSSRKAHIIPACSFVSSSMNLIIPHTSYSSVLRINSRVSTLVVKKKQNFTMQQRIENLPLRVQTIPPRPACRRTQKRNPADDPTTPAPSTTSRCCCCYS